MVTRTTPPVDDQSVPASPFQVVPVSMRATRPGMQPPVNRATWRYIADVPDALPLDVVVALDGGAVWPDPPLRRDYPFWPLVWARPSATSTLPAGVTLPEAQADYDTAAAALIAAGYRSERFA